MGYIIVDEEKFKASVSLWDSRTYMDDAMFSLSSAAVDYSHMIKALQQAEEKIDSDIKELEKKKNSINYLMRFVSTKEEKHK